MPDIARCPQCHEPLRATWKYCPNCQAALVGLAQPYEVPPVSRRRPRSAQPAWDHEQEARFDTRWIGFGLLVLAVMGGFTGVMVLLNTDLRHLSIEAFFIVGFGVVLVGTVGMALALGGRSGTAAGFANGTLGGLAVDCLGAALALLTVVSMVIVAIQDCLRTCRGGR